MGFTKPCSHPLPPTSTHFHSLPPTPTHSYLLPPIPTHFHLLTSTLINSHPLPLTPTHCYSFLTQSHSFSTTPTHSSPPMCTFSHPFPVHIQILSPNSTHHLPFQLIFSPCALRAYTNFNVSLFFLLFSVLFRKQLIT